MLIKILCLKNNAFLNMFYDNLIDKTHCWNKLSGIGIVDWHSGNSMVSPLKNYHLLKKCF